MFLYYLRMATISIKENPVLSGLMVLAIGAGIGMLMMMSNIAYAMFKNPLPEKADVLYRVLLDAGDPQNPPEDPDNVPIQVTYTDATNLFRLGKEFRQSVAHGVSATIESEDPDIYPSLELGRATTSDFFSLFNVPFKYGGPWSRETDQGIDQVVVLSNELNQRQFGDVNSVGKTIILHGLPVTIVGVLDDWELVPRIYDMTSGPGGPTELFFVPLSWSVEHSLARNGNTNCWKPIDGTSREEFLNSECVWLQLWAELPSTEEFEAYELLLTNYTMDQKELGRFGRPLNNRLYTLDEWLTKRSMTNEGVYVIWSATAMFFIVCLLNSVGLLLAKIYGKSLSISIRRALGATKSDLAYQFFLESALVGVLGGILGLGIAYASLEGIEWFMSSEALIERLTELDLQIVLAGIAVGVLGSVLAGLYPIWRACQTNISTQLKSN